MSIRASLFARLKRLEQRRESPTDENIRQMIEELSVGSLFELSSLSSEPSPRMRALLARLERECSSEDELIVRVLESLLSEQNEGTTALQPGSTSS
jgi:hypothetical protein